MKVYQQLASLIAARANCEKSGNREWHAKHGETIAEIVSDYMPRGSGFDSGTRLSLEESSPEKLVFHTAFHHMDEHGFYSGWTEHKVTVRPSLAYGFLLTISGRDRNDIKEYMYDVFTAALDAAYVRPAPTEGV